MQLIKEEDNPELFRFTTDKNLLRQYDLLRTTVEIALTTPQHPISHEAIRQLNNAAVVFLCESPGLYRKKPVYIKNTPHVPPPHEQVEDLMNECLQYLADRWVDGTALHLAAYALWRLNWIHPFVEGNGRTARVTCHHILCVKSNFWLPGANTVPQQIRANRVPYYEGLRAADDAFKQGGVDVSVLEAYLEQLLTIQLMS